MMVRGVTRDDDSADNDDDVYLGVRGVYDMGGGEESE
jgi:hypothetical protein